MYLVIGSGIAGLSAALRIAAQRGAGQVVVVTKGAIDDSNTRYAQGGIAAAVGPDDDPTLHAEDTVAVGCGLNVADVVATVCRQGADLVRELEQIVAFDRREDGTLALGLEAAHRRHRVLHAGGDATGRAIAEALIASVRATGIRVMEHTAVEDVLTKVRPDGSRAVSGVRVLDIATGAVEDLPVSAVLLATGGIGQVYAYTTNPSVATGDGIALAWRAGAMLADMEFVQFHPTSLNWQQHFLISEAVRGEGAVLRDSDGERFMVQVHPLAELAPRDVVARGIKQAMERGEVSLDARALANSLATRFPTIDATLHRAGFDWQHELIPVSPAAHYMMGGVAADIDGRTTVVGLFAAGEVASTGFHGANRLASNSLLEGLVMGTRAADVMVQGDTEPLNIESSGTHSSSIESQVQDLRFDEPMDTTFGRADEVTSPVEIGARDREIAAGSTGAQLADIREQLRNVMWDDAGIVRTRDGLERARLRLSDLQQQLAAVSTVALDQRADRLEVHNMLTVGQLIVEAALRRDESRGSHARLDYSETVPELAVRHYLRRDMGGNGQSVNGRSNESVWHEVHHVMERSASQPGKSSVGSDTFAMTVPDHSAPPSATTATAATAALHTRKENSDAAVEAGSRS